MNIGYLRISTEEQRPDRQIIGLEELCDELHIETVSAVSKKRPVYEAVMAKLQRGDTLVVWDLDRAYRSVVEALLEMERMRNAGIIFRIVMLNVDTSTPDGELFYTMVAAFAQYERRILIKRTKEGMEAAKKRGKHIGRPRKLSNSQIEAARSEINHKGCTITATAAELGVCRDTLARRLS